MTGPTDDAPDVDALAAVLRADSADIDVYARVMTTSLADALPPDMVIIDRQRSMGDRMAGRPGVVASLRIAMGDWQLELIRGRGGIPEAKIAQRVRGVVISSRQVGIDEWVGLLARLLAEQAKASSAAREALGRLLGQSG